MHVKGLPMTEQVEGAPAPKIIASKSGGRGIAVFAFIVAICALALGAYLGYRLVYLQPFAVQTQQVEELVKETEQKILAELDAGMSDSRRVISGLAQSLRQENLDVQKELRQAVAQSLEEAVANKPDDTTPMALGRSSVLDALCKPLAVAGRGCGYRLASASKCGSSAPRDSG
jgi:hypothetical protein